MSLEGARRDVILVLGRAEQAGRSPIDGWRKASSSKPVPMVNTTAALNLARLRPRIVGTDFGDRRRYRFYLTQRGRQLFEQIILEAALGCGGVLTSKSGRRWVTTAKRTAQGYVYLHPVGATGFGGVKGRRVEIAGMYDRGWRLYDGAARNA